jgi:hypothetical protein
MIKLDNPEFARQRMLQLKGLALSFARQSGVTQEAGIKLQAKVAGRWLPTYWTGVFVREPGRQRGRCIGAVYLPPEALPFVWSGVNP